MWCDFSCEKHLSDMTDNRQHFHFSSISTSAMGPLTTQGVHVLGTYSDATEGKRC